MYDLVVSFFVCLGLILFVAAIGLIIRGHGWFIIYLADLVTSLITHSSAEIITNDTLKDEYDDEAD